MYLLYMIIVIAIGVYYPNLYVLYCYLYPLIPLGYTITLVVLCCYVYYHY